jgi:hypothetical protein
MNPGGFATGTANSYAAGIGADPNAGFDKLTFGTDGTDAYIQSFAGVLHLNLAGQNVVVGNTTPVTFTPQGAVIPQLYQTGTKCAANGTAANPSVVSCVAAAAGMFSCATNASTGTCQVNTTAVTANSEIFITQDAADGGASQLNVTCNTGNVLSTSAPILAAKVAATSFTINLGTVIANPACFEYHIIN